MGIDRLLREAQFPAPGLSRHAAARIARDQYGIEGVCQPLAGERDDNFRLDGKDGSRHLLKIWNHSQDPAVVDFQLALLIHLQKHASSLPVPRIVPDRTGNSCATVDSGNGHRHAACLMSWLEGAPLREARLHPRLSNELGTVLASLDRALTDFHHPASHRDMLWDVTRAGRLRELIPAVGDPGMTRIAECMLDRLTDRVVDVLATLPHQVIHGDFNPDNVLVTPGATNRVCGIIDFGDALLAPRICELAIAAAYQLVDDDDPLSRVLPLLSAYHRVTPLHTGELSVLAALMGARLVSSLLITSHMASLHPSNREYLLVDTRSAGKKLQRLLAHDDETLADRVAAACPGGPG